jgi:hypothetical protein
MGMTISQALIKICRFKKETSEIFSDPMGAGECSDLIGAAIEREEEELSAELIAAGWSNKVIMKKLEKVGMHPELAHYISTL